MLVVSGRRLEYVPSNSLAPTGNSVSAARGAVDVACPIAIRPNWHLVIVVPEPPRTWVVTRTDLARDSLGTVLTPLDSGQSPSPIRSLLKPPARLLPTPVGSRSWIELLAAGGGEAQDGALAP
jgi:hypothetical protein